MSNACILYIFGATGDLAQRKLLPAIYYLESERLLKDNFQVFCIGRKQLTTEQYRKSAIESIRKFSKTKIHEDTLIKAANRLQYHSIDFSKKEDYGNICMLSEKGSDRCDKIFYLAVPSSLFETIAANLRQCALLSEGKDSFNRVVFEKPFGHDLKSAKELNSQISKVFDEEQIYRIDHYVAKELVQNLVVLRFANSIFEPLWNRRYIDHVQITVAETLGMEGRGEYYDKAGAIRDVIQNHMLQLLSLIAMNDPKKFDPMEIKKEKIKVLKSIRIDKRKLTGNIVIGQYSDGMINGQKVLSYLDEKDANKNSKTETYAALKLEISNSMWQGVPFYVRTGKRLKDKSTEIVIVYKNIPYGLFKQQAPQTNKMIIRVQPYEGITLQFNAKVPGGKLIIDDVTMDFCHECTFGTNTPEAYERLLQDVISGDRTLFTEWGEVEASWKIADSILSEAKNTSLYRYPAGSWGPKEADRLLVKDRRYWVEPKKPSYAELLEKK